MNIIQGNRQTGKTSFLIQFIREIQNSSCKVLMVVETYVNRLDMDKLLSTTKPIAQVVTIDLDHKSWIDVASALVLDMYDVVILDTCITCGSIQWSDVVTELMKRKSSIVLSTIDTSSNTMTLQCIPSLCTDALDQLLFQNIVNKSNINNLHPFQIGKSSPAQMGQAMHNLAQQVSAMNGNTITILPQSGKARNLVLDDLDNDATITLGCHTMTKTALMDIIGWWYR